MNCPLCSSTNHHHFFETKTRHYHQCARCQLVWMDPAHHLSAEDEKAEYLRHENHPSDPGYRKFLSRLVAPLCERLQPQSNGLDFGCGPGPTLSVMLEEAGHQMALYDPYFFSDREVLEQRYDFITATEVVEHLAQPGMELTALYASLHPGGWLGIMTKRVLDRDAFSRWHYKNDPTHICFFHLRSFEWLAQHLNAALYVVSNDVVLLHKAPSD